MLRSYSKFEPNYLNKRFSVLLFLVDCNVKLEQNNKTGTGHKTDEMLNMSKTKPRFKFLPWLVSQNTSHYTDL